LTLGHLAVRAGVSKPVAYDHFGTRANLLIELYRRIDTEKVKAFQGAMARSERSLDETIDLPVAAYIDCAADTNGELYAVGAALAGSEEKAVVFQELLDNSVQMFTSVLQPHCTCRTPNWNGAASALSAQERRFPLRWCGASAARLKRSRCLLR
jgi:AcrR family transcriptional regulator